MTNDKSLLILPGEQQRVTPFKIAWVFVLLLLGGISITISYISSTSSDPSEEYNKDRTKSSTLLFPRQHQTIIEKQIDNYIQGKALAINVHITHHGGTMVCWFMRVFGPTPAFGCNSPGQDGFWPENGVSHRDFPWSYNDTSQNINFIRPHFHFIGWEFGVNGNLHGPALHETDWENENLVSMIVMRNPLDRFLADGKCNKFHSMINDDPTNETQDLYWQYASHQCSDNYALRSLANHSNCANGYDTSIECLESAKNLIKRFTFIINQDCLNDSLLEIGKILKLNHTKVNDFISYHNKTHNVRSKGVTARERLQNDTLYEFLQQRFRRDIELYEWSKMKSIVQC